MIVGVIATPERHKFLPKVIELLAPKARKFTLFNDVAKAGYTENFMECMETCLGEARRDEPVVLTTDDVIAVPDWYERFLAIHAEAKSELYCLFTRSRSMLKYRDSGWARGVFKKGFWDCGCVFINQPTLVKRIRYWQDHEGGRESASPEWRSKWADMFIEDYFVAKGIPWVVTVPTLFEHVGGNADSTHGHVAANDGKSICYMGDVVSGALTW